MEKSTLRKTDLVFSLILMALSVYVFFESIVLFFNPFGRDWERISGDTIKQAIEEWYTSPALMPFLLALVLFFCATMLYRNARREGAKFDFFTKEKIMNLVTARETHVAIIVTALLIVYIYVLMPVCRSYLNFFPTFQAFPFMIATVIYLFAMMVLFNEKTGKKILTSLIVAAGAAAFIAVGFGVLAMIPLP